MCSTLIGTHGWDSTALGGIAWLNFAFLGVPSFVFFATFFFGHAVVSALGLGREEQWWLDKLCIRQTREAWKLAGVQMLPTFVQSSDRLVLLWSESYFSRLWCACEMATFLSTHHPHAVDVQPLWLAPWMLSTIAVDIGCGFLVQLLMPGNGVLPPVADWNAAFGTFGTVPAAAIAMGFGYAPSILPNLIAFRAKAQAHRRMIEQLDEFTLGACLCAVESDRAHVEAHIAKLFGAHADPIEAFEAMVRKDFKSVVVSKVGTGASGMPLSLALLPFLPLYWSSANDIFGCDGAACAQNAADEGFDSGLQLVLAAAGAWAFMLSLTSFTYPFIFWALERTEQLEGAWARNLAGAAAIFFAFFVIMGAASGVGATCSSRWWERTVRIRGGWRLEARPFWPLSAAWEGYSGHRVGVRLPVCRYRRVQRFYRFYGGTGRVWAFYHFKPKSTGKPLTCYYQTDPFFAVRRAARAIIYMRLVLSTHHLDGQCPA